ncbi:MULTISPECIES: hypothetical protein [unclassified Pseudomonas]|uniref:hypothetical protein n=1 Tax=unclassified Pseudomonas TaxID=196821 RepID=UPI000A1FDCBF|nr:MULTISPECIES: hypothetical protein [unclassified Pseudomonas]
MNEGTGSFGHEATLVGDVLLTGVRGQPMADYGFARDCTYLAKREADRVYNSSTQPGRWIDYCADLLWSHGWNRDQPSVEYVQPQFSGSVKQAWIRVATALLSRAQVAGVEAGLTSLERRADLLEATKGLSGKAFDLKIVPVSYNAAGDMELVVTHVRFIKSSLNTRYLFWDISQAMTQLDIRARRVVISRRVMEARRPSVAKAMEKLSFGFKDYEL